jgi:hypothetical protein
LAFSQPPISFKTAIGTPRWINQLAHVWRKSCHLKSWIPASFRQPFHILLLIVNRRRLLHQMTPPFANCLYLRVKTFCI